jgi:hypothetical protein
VREREREREGEREREIDREIERDREGEEVPEERIKSFALSAQDCPESSARYGLSGDKRRAREEPVKDSQGREDLSWVRGRAHSNLAGIGIPGREVQSSLCSCHRGQEVSQRDLRTGGVRERSEAPRDLSAHKKGRG